MNEPPPPPPPGGPTPGSGQGPDWGEMKGKISAAKGPDRIALIAGVVFIIASFLPWFSVHVGAIGGSGNAWDVGGIAMIASVLAIIATIFALLRVLDVKFTIPMSDATLLTVLGVLVFLLCLLRILVKPGGGDVLSALSAGTVRITRGIGLYIAVVASAALAWAGIQKLKAEKTP